MECMLTETTGNLAPYILLVQPEPSDMHRPIAEQRKRFGRQTLIVDHSMRDLCESFACLLVCLAVRRW